VTTALEDTAARLTLLRRVAELANAADSVTAAATHCLDLVLEVTGWSLGHFCTVPDAGAGDVWRSDDLERFAPFCRAVEASIRTGDGGLVRRVVESGRAVTVTAPHPELPEVLADAAEAGIERACAFPVWVRDEVAGVAEFFDAGGRPVDEAVVEVLEQVGTQLGRVVERERHARAAAASEDQARAVIDYAGDPYVALDEEGRITGWNLAAERTFGWAAAEVLGRPLAEVLVPERYREAHRAGLARFRSTGEGPMLGQRFELSALHRDGRELPVELAVWAVRGADGHWSFSGFVVDITERRVAERELQVAYERERDMVAQLTQLDRNKADFMSMISHELRTPLTSIVGYVDLLNGGHGGPLTERQGEMLAVVERNAQRLLELIDDIVTLDRLESGRLPLEIGAVDVGRLVRQVVDAVSPLAAARGQHLTTDVREGAGSLAGDAAQLERVLLNLATNAVKFTPKGGVVSVVADGDDAGVRLAVVDTGMGIPPSEQPRIFTRFFRSSRARAAAVPGTGLGLVIARSIVEAHGGSIELVSAEDEGTVVTVTLPRSGPDA